MKIRENGEITVLYVDDDPHSRSLVKELLEQDESINVRAEGIPEEALESLGDGDIDCLVSDYDMPQMNGLELLEGVRNVCDEVPFILFTGKGTEDIASRAISKGVADYVQKGDSDHYDLLINKIKTSVRNYRNKNELDDVYEAMETNMDGVAIVNQSNEYVYANESYASIHGYSSADEVADTSLCVHYDDSTVEFIRNHVRKVIQEGEKWQGHLVGIKLNGDDFRQSASITQISNGNIVIVVRRIENEKMDAEIRKREVLINELTENVPYGVVIEDEKRDIRAVNSSFIEIFGLEEYSKQELIGKNCEEFAEEVKHKFQEPEEFIESVNNLVDEREKSLRDELRTTNDRYIERSYVPYTTPDGDANMWVLFDVTEQRQAFEALKQEKKRMSQFAKVISHDLKNPLNVIKGRAGLMKQDYDGEHLEPIEDSADRMVEIIDDVTKIVRERESIEDLDTVDIPKLAQETWKTIETKDAQLSVESDFCIQADRAKLKSIFENLYCNAVNHGGSDVTVTVEETDNGFAVYDSGEGIPESEIDSVFEFGHSTRRNSTGFGLGIVKQIVNAHDWEITVTNGEAGARFDIDIQTG